MGKIYFFLSFFLFFQCLTFMKIFRLISFATEKALFQSFSELQALFFVVLFFIFKFMLQLPDLSPFSFSFNFCFQLSFCLLYAAIHDLLNKALFSGKTSASVDLFCRALYLLFKAFGKPSKLRNSFELSAILWNELFSGSKSEKQILRIKHKFPITGFCFFFPQNCKK